MLNITSSPWTEERLVRGFIHVVGAENPLGDRDVVALVNGRFAAANAALICAASLTAWSASVSSKEKLPASCQCLNSLRKASASAGGGRGGS